VRGFSLIELMIAMSLSLLAIVAAGNLLQQVSRSYQEDDKAGRLQDELRFAMAQVGTDLAMAGFRADVRADARIAIDGSATAALARDCGPTTDGAPSGASNNWVYRESRAMLATLGDAVARDAAAAFPCIDPDELLPGTDILGLKRVGDATNAPTAGQVYLRTDGRESTIYRHGGSAPAPHGDAASVHEYRPVVWYVRRYSVAPDERPRIPALCRKVLVGGSMQADPAGCVAQGIEDFQLEFGLDDVAAPDGTPDTFVEFVAPPAPSELARVVAVRVHLLGRALRPQPGYRNAKTYVLAGKTIAPREDGYFRASASATVALRNVAWRLAPLAVRL
jgi:type IV pilus assembly protein PilW